MRPFERLHPEEHQAAEDGEEEEETELAALALPDTRERLDHGDAAADQQERHERGERDAEDRRRPRPVRVAVAERAVSCQQGAEGHRVGGEEDPHAELPPALWGERGLGGLVEMMLGDGGCGAHAQLSSGPVAGAGTGRVTGMAITSARCRPRRRWARNSQPAARPKMV